MNVSKMMSFARPAFGAGLIAGLLGAAAFPARAQDAGNYPNRAIRLIVPFAAGGGNDIFGRLVGAKASEFLGQQIIVENRPAAAGRVAAEFVVGQPADGYTLFIGASGVMSIAAAVWPKLNYHPTKNFIALAMIADFPLILVSPVQLPPKTVAELVAYAKANPDKSTYASTSPAFTITTELLKLKTGMPGVMLPVKSSMEMVQCVAQALCLMAISDGPPAIPQIKDGRVRAIAVTGSERSPELPDVPSMKEAGFPEVNAKLWSGVFAATGTPPAITKKLEEVFQRAVADPGVSAKLKGMAVTPGNIPAAQFQKQIEAEIDVYAQVVKAANLTFE